MAKRIQRKRSKGWRMPEDTVYVGRPTKWGNPVRLGAHFQIPNNPAVIFWEAFEPQDGFTTIQTREQAVEFFRAIVQRKSDSFIKQVKAELRGKDLACWCPIDQPCHADVLLEIANA